MSDTCRKAWRGFTNQRGSALGKGKRVLKSALKQRGFGPPVFEKAFKCFAAMAMACSPTGFQEEFLVDSGAERNLISTKDMPSQWNDFIADAPEQLKFATGGGMRPSSKAIKLKGELSGEGIFYTLKDCPAALSLKDNGSMNREKHGCGFLTNFRFSSNRIACQMSHSIVQKVPRFMSIVSNRMVRIGHVCCNAS